MAFWLIPLFLVVWASGDFWTSLFVTGVVWALCAAVRKEGRKEGREEAEQAEAQRYRWRHRD